MPVLYLKKYLSSGSLEKSSHYTKQAAASRGSEQNCDLAILPQDSRHGSLETLLIPGGGNLVHKMRQGHVLYRNTRKLERRTELRPKETGATGKGSFYSKMG